MMPNPATLRYAPQPVKMRLPATFTLSIYPYEFLKTLFLSHSQVKIGYFGEKDADCMLGTAETGESRKTTDFSERVSRFFSAILFLWSFQGCGDRLLNFIHQYKADLLANLLRDVG